MLRHEILTNFIHFQDQKKFDFLQGANFFIGENSSGKTTVFEAARRCLSVKQNTSLSSSHFPRKISAATCIFYLNGERHGKLFSSTIRLPDDPSGVRLSPVYVKVAFESSKKEYGIDLVKETEAMQILVNETVNVSEPELVKAKDLIEKFLQFDASPEEAIIKDLLTLIHEGVKGKVSDFIANNEQIEVVDTDCENILRRYVDPSTIFTFSVRGIGPCQWSWSPKVTNDWKVANYETAQERSEILQWYLGEVQKGNISEEDQNLADKYFDIITNYCGFGFKLKTNVDSDEKELVAFNKKTGKRILEANESMELFIMKVPEGILEARNNSILLGVSRFSTVCLEEPEKGMHPQMIERMRDLVLRKIEDKNIMVTSHHPWFLGPWTVPKLHIFRRTENRDGISFQAFTGSRIGQGDTDKKTPRIITSDHFASIFFAKRVLFVMGEGDYLFTSALQQLFLTDEKLTQDLVKLDPEGLERFRVFLCSLQIIALSGETQKLRFNRLCEAIEMERYFLLDYDAILDDKYTANTFLKNFNLTNRYKSDDVLRNVQILEKEGLFVWRMGEAEEKSKTGTIEDVLIALTGDYGKLKDIFKENNVTLKYNPKTKMNNRYKLFLRKEVTDENIATVVHKVMKCCVDDKRHNRSTDMLRLVNFLDNISQESHRKSFSR